MFFANEQRENVRSENPGIAFGSFHLRATSMIGNLWMRWLPTCRTGQVGKVLGERWKALSEKQRQPYEAKAIADKKRYEDEKAAYNVSSVPLSPQV